MAPSGRKGTATKVHQCPDCEKTFSRREYVMRHSRLAHQGARPFVCEACQNSFARSDILRRHRKTCGSLPKNEEEEKEMKADGPFPYPIVTSDPNGGPSFPDLTGVTSAVSCPYPPPFPPSTSISARTVSPNAPSLSPPGGPGSSSSSVNSPETPYSLDFPSNVVTGADQTLAPELMRGSSFTQDEILASEVLEDLLRSPQYASRRLGSPSFIDGGQDEEGMETIGSSKTPWHGATALVGQENISSSVVGGAGWEYDQPDPNGIEFSPEAVALADYFNKGGVGGISALDLGFSSTPSLFPDHLFTSETYLHTERDRKFFLPTQKFCLGYLYPWSIPQISTLSKFAARAADEFLPSVPVIHSGTMVLSEAPTHTAFALTVVGAAYEHSAEGESFSNEMLVEKRVFLVRSFNKEGTSEDERFASLQSMLLYQLLGLFHQDEQHRMLAHTFHAALVLMLRELALPTKIRQTPLAPPDPNLTGDALDAAWKEWVKVETWRRVSYIVFLVDLETATHFDAAPLLPFSELNIDLPSSDALWNANNAEEWLARITSPLNPTSVSFLDAIRALLSSTEPLPFSSEGILLAELARLSSFPLLVLSRTLSFLQQKTEEAINQVDPFRTLLGGFGIFEGREQENRDVLRRVINGRETLKRLPGGIKRGGGEGWFEGVMPNATGKGREYAGAPSCAQAENSWEEETSERTRAGWEKLADRRAEQLGREFPSFMGL